MNLAERTRAILHRALQRVGYDINRYPGNDFDRETRRIVEAVRPFTATSPARLYEMRQAVRHVVRTGVPGAIVEAGVWRGGSMMMAAWTLLELNDVSRDLYLYDTFDGMVEPTEDDVRVDGADASSLLAGADRRRPTSAWRVASLDDAARNVRSTGYPEARLRFVRGRVEETVPAVAPETIAILRLDTDWYESTYHELVHLYPRLAPGGVLIVDDYGHWGGARKAVDQYIAEQGLRLFLHRIDDTGRSAIKV